jgi:hypothetical protein
VTLPVIPIVLATDLVFAAAAFGLCLLSRSTWSRRLTCALFVYTLIEAAFHVPMEALAARWLF